MYLELTDANQLTMYQIESQNNFVPLILWWIDKTYNFHMSMDSTVIMH